MKKSVGRPPKTYPRAKSVSELKKVLFETGTCELSGLGVFTLRRINARKFNDRWTGKLVTMQPYTKIAFTPNKNFSAEVKNLVK